MKHILARAQPIPRAGSPRDVANAALLFLASGTESSFVNGHALVVDGGILGGRLWSEYTAGLDRLRAALGAGG